MKSTLFSWYWTQLNDDRSYINGFFFHAEQICLDNLDTMRQFCLAFKSPQFTFSFLFCLFNDVCKMLFKDKMWNNKFYTWSARIEMLHFIIQIGVKLLCHHLFAASKLSALKNFKKRKLMLIAPSLFTVHANGKIPAKQNKPKNFIQSNPISNIDSKISRKPFI